VTSPLLIALRPAPGCFGGGPNYSVLDLSSKGSPQCSTSVSLVLTSITMSLISMFGGAPDTSRVGHVLSWLTFSKRRA
jgi:hypothetical protein